MKVLITGITGYIGSHLAKACIKEGWKVHGLVRFNSNFELLEQNSIRNNIDLHEFQGGVESLQKIIQHVKPDIVVHMATLYLAQHQSNDVKALVDSNIKFGAELLEGMRVEGVRKIVVAETTWQYDPHGKARPVNLYAAMKEAFAVLLRYYVDAYRFSAVQFKLFDTYGGYDNRPKLLNKLKQIAGTEEVLELSKGGQIVDFTHIDDVVRAFMIGIQRVRTLKKGKSEEYVISGDRKTLRNWIRMIQKISSKEIIVKMGVKPYREREVMQPWANGKRIKGWKPFISSEEGLRKFFRTF